jgi:hypothetical protein
MWTSGKMMMTTLSPIEKVLRTLVLKKVSFLFLDFCNFFSY